MSILEMTLMGGIMVLVITVLRAVLLNKLPKRMFIFLWEIAMARLVLPISIPAVTSVYSLLSLFKGSETAMQTTPQPPFTNILVTTNDVESLLQENIQMGLFMSVCTVMWFVGMAIIFTVFVIGYIIIYRRYRYATIVKDGYAAEWLSEQKIHRKIRILRSEQIGSPLTYGIFRPTIILPESLENNQSEELTFILTHEMTHIKRFDMLRKIAAAAVLCVHWFNPLVWVLYLLYNRDIEIACDEAVVRKMNSDCRSAYAMALIGMEERRRGFSSLYSNFSKNAVEERIVAIMKTKKIGVISIVAACVLSLGVICGFAASSVTDEKDEDQKPYLHYIFDDDEIREVTEDEFNSTIGNKPGNVDQSSSAVCGSAASSVTNEKEDGEPYLHYIFNNDEIREVTEDEFNSEIGNKPGNVDQSSSAVCGSAVASSATN